jgi:hypothetical protein
MDRICKSLNQTGEPCGAQHYQDGYCRWHFPGLAAQRQAERAAGGAARSNKARARKRILSAVLDLHEIDGALCRALIDVLSGTLEPGIATAAATVARTVSTIRTASELEARLSALEEQVGIATIRRFS